MGGRGSAGGTRSTYRGNSTQLFRQQQQLSDSSTKGGGGGGGGKNKQGSSSKTGGIQTGKGKGGGGAPVVTEKEQGLVDSETLFLQSDEYKELEKKFAGNPDAFERAYDNVYAKWLASQKIVTPTATRPATPDAGAAWYDSRLKHDRKLDTVEEIAASVDRINRRFKSTVSDQDREAHRINCQRVTDTIEMMFRGVDQVAAPITIGYRPKRWNPKTKKFVGKGASLEDIEKMWRNPDFDPDTDDPDNEFGAFFTTWQEGQVKTREEVAAEIDYMIEGWDEGARGFVYVQWDDDTAHIFNVIVKDGKPLYIDGQPNQGRDGAELVNRTEWQRRVSASKYWGVMRVDYLEPTEKVGTWMRDPTPAEMTVPTFAELVAEYARRGWAPTSPEQIALRNAFFAAWSQVRMSIQPQMPPSIKNIPELVQAFEEGVAFSRRPD